MQEKLKCKRMRPSLFYTNYSKLTLASTELFQYRFKQMVYNDEQQTNRQSLCMPPSPPNLTLNHVEARVWSRFKWCRKRSDNPNVFIFFHQVAASNSTTIMESQRRDLHSILFYCLSRTIGLLILPSSSHVLKGITVYLYCTVVYQ